MTSPEITAWLAPAALYAVGALAALALPWRARVVANAVAVAASAVGIAVAMRILLGGTTERVSLFSAGPYVELVFRIDPLAAWFLLVLSTVALAVSVYAVGYLDAHSSSSRALTVGFDLFLLTMDLVVLADGVVAFLFAWEAMSLVSFFLVIHDHDQASARRAGFIYIVMTHVGTAFLFVAFMLLYASTGTFGFDGFRLAHLGLAPQLRDAIFVLVLVGFGTKAGVFPLHVWLPRAHPAAPSHISALMSGIMIKTAVYGLIRVVWEFAGPGPTWWGSALLLLGVVSAVMGVLYALMEHDLKRLLAYHSVENIGIIFIGLGAAQALSALDRPALAALAMAAALFHVFNHAIFKALLFLGAGAIQRATHTRDLERLGGLIRPMPWTAATFLVGAMAISALPPLNGFMSEWLTFQGLLHLAGTTREPVGIGGVALAAALLALTSGLAAYCFVKAFGVAFLGLPRKTASAPVREAPRAMVGGMTLLAALCVVMGIGAQAILDLLAPVTGMLLGGRPDPLIGLALAPERTSGVVAPAGVLVLLLVLGSGGLLLARLVGGPSRTRIGPTWVCGIDLEPRMQYSASALAKPVRVIFGALLRSYRHVERERRAGPYFVSAVRYEAGLHPIYERHLYGPLADGILYVAHQVRRLQSGSLRLYLGYMLAALIAVLLMAR